MHKLLRDLIGPFYSAVHTLPKIALSPSYYPELPRKNFLRRYLELIAARFTERSTNLLYNAYGLDCKIPPHPTGGGYVCEREFWSKIISQNYPGQVNHAVVLRDKLLFFLFMDSFGIPTPRVLAHSKRGCYWFGCREVSRNEFLNQLRAEQRVLFIKDCTSCNGMGVWRFDCKGGRFMLDGKDVDDDSFLLNQMDKVDLIVQESISNHADIAHIYPKSVNTARLITVWDDVKNCPVLFTQFFRFGANGNSMDNWAAGGLLLSLSDKGEIGEFGYYKNIKFGGLKTDTHPDTGIAFRGLCVPHYEKALELCLKAHLVLPGIKSIGWDVAFTPDGPCLIEGNDDWEIAPAQIVNGGLRDRAHEYFGV